MAEPKTEPLYIRVPIDLKQAFMAKAERNGRSTSDVLRELVTAWCEGRAIIHPHE